MAKRAIAFYLPQYHPIPENDMWWGKGFTEWRNVTRASSQYDGHDQPAIPAELGYYDLRVPEVFSQQVGLAKEYGIFAFCFYYYNFSGKRLLERPLDDFANRAELDFPFCVCWANETWSRRWDGSERDILVQQQYSPAHATMLFEDLAVYLEKSHYLTIDGAKPLLIYRPDEIPGLREYANTWRVLAAKRGWKLNLLGCLTFGLQDPTRFGLDGAVQFPPHGAPAAEISESLSVANNFSGKIYSYPSLVAHQLAEPSANFPLFRGVMPSWDNTARRQNNSHIYHGASPELFALWLNTAFSRTYTDATGDSYVFINAWNEWAEGAYLEPDVANGRRRLEALRAAVSGKFSFDFATKYLKECAISLSDAEILSPAIEAIERAFVAQDSLVREMEVIIERERSQYDLFNRVLPSSELTLSPRDTVFLPGAIGSIDALGGNGLENGYQVHKGARGLFVGGWILPPTPAGATNEAILVVLVAGRDGRTVFFESERLGEREDVANALPGWPRDRARRSGVELYLDVSSLPTGPYTAAVAIQIGGFAYLLESRRTIVIDSDQRLSGEN